MRQALLLVVGLGILLPGSFASAALLYLDSSDTNVHPGDTLAVAVRLETDPGECVNVVDGVINLTGGLIPVDISRGASIVPLWVEEPQIDQATNQVTFAGGIPNGYCGRIDGDPKLTNILFEILVQAPGFSVGIGERDETAAIRFAPETQVFLNDGTGTVAPLTTFDREFVVHTRPRAESVNEWTSRIGEDGTPPQEFSIELSTDPSIYGGRYFITFNTTDKESGLDRYEVIEEPLDQLELFRWGRVDAPWQTARSPYLLEDQSLNSTIRVRAIDKAGNEYLAVLVPPEELRGRSDRDYVRAGLFVAGTLVILVTLLTVLAYRRRRRTEQS
jgi:hypothetical protein